MGKGKRRQIADKDQFENEILMRKQLREMMYHSGQQHLRFICTQKLINEFWNEHSVEKIVAFQKYDQDVFTKIKNRFLRVLSIAIFTEWNDLIRFSPVFVQEGLDDNSLFFDESRLSLMETGIDNFVAQQYLFKPETIKQTRQSLIQECPDMGRLPFINEPELLGRGGFGSVSKMQIAPYCLDRISEDGVRSSNQGVSVASHCNVHY